MPCGKESSPRIAIGRKLLTEDPSCEAVDMTAPEAFTTASKQPLTTGRRPDMAAICGYCSLMSQGQELFRVSTLSGACVLCVLVRHCQGQGEGPANTGVSEDHKHACMPLSQHHRNKGARRPRAA